MRGMLHEIVIDGEILGYGYVTSRHSCWDGEAHFSIEIELVETIEPEVIR